jgi:hypothetical protein
VSKFNSRHTAVSMSSPIKATTATDGEVTYEGGAATIRDEKSELFLLAVHNMVGEKTFYEDAGSRDKRFEELVRVVATTDPEWMLAFTTWLRSEANMRSASIVMALEAAKAMVAAGLTGSRKIVRVALQRADEPGEALAYWTSNYGMKIPKPVKRGIADACARLYTEYSLLKYDTPSHAFRFGRVLDIVHAKPAPFEAAWQGPLFRHAQDRMRGHQSPLEVMSALKMVELNAVVRFNMQTTMSWDQPWDVTELIAKSGLTWEDVLSLVGNKVEKKLLWTALIPVMGYMAQLRNLRNFDEAGVSDEVAEKVIDRLSDPDQVRRSRQFPLRFLSAYRAAPSLRWSYGLEKALNVSLENIPVLKGRTLIMVDHSGSMDSPLSNYSGLSYGDGARIFGSALALRAENPEVFAYNGGYMPITIKKGSSLLSTIKDYPPLGGGTATWQILQHLYKNHDRVVILTDEQAFGSPAGVGIAPSTNVYTVNLAGYKYGHAPSGTKNMHTFGGLTDQMFKVMPLLERGKDAPWPWEI